MLTVHLASLSGLSHRMVIRLVIWLSFIPDARSGANRPIYHVWEPALDFASQRLSIWIGQAKFKPGSLMSNVRDDPRF